MFYHILQEGEPDHYFASQLFGGEPDHYVLR
jgi:hypothetical protein